MINRDKALFSIKKNLKAYPVVAILGPRQCGKSTLAKQIGADYFFDLENPADVNRLSEPQLVLESLQGLIVIDEVQRMPDLFPLLRYLVDNKKQKYLILGSASRDLIRQSSESLAGRIHYHELGGFSLAEVGAASVHNLWLRGGYPRSFLAKTNEQSVLWRENYVSTFLERDVPQLGIQIPAITLRRFWTMVSHYHGQVINYSEIAGSFGISDVTVKKYLDILCGTFMLRQLPPWHGNLKKRLVKSPKIYFRDTGLFHSLQTINRFDDLMAHPKLGASWEGFAMHTLMRHLGFSAERFYFWGTHSGAELDLFWQNGGKNYGAEFKYSLQPKITKSMLSAQNDLHLHHLSILYPGKESYPIAKNVTVNALSDFT